MRIASEKSNACAPAFTLLALLVSGSAPAQTSLGPCTGHRVDGASITVFAGASSIRFLFPAQNVARVDFLPDSTSRPDSSFTVVNEHAPGLGFTITDSDTTLSIRGPGLTVQCAKNPLRLRFLNASGTLLVAEPPSGGLGTLGTQRWARFHLSADEALYGTGARNVSLDLRGHAFQSTNTQVYGYSGPFETGSVNVPLLLSSRGYGIFFDNTWKGWFDLGANDPERLVYRSEGGELTLYVTGGTPEQVLERYTRLTGPQALPPRWAFGYLQSKFGYRTEQEARDVVATLRFRRIPCDALILDLYWFRHMGDLQWNSAAWPSPFLMMSDFLAAGVKTVTITEPYVVEPSGNYGIAFANGLFARTATGAPYILPSWWSCNCNAGLVDLTDPAARTWWWNLHPPFMGNHVAGLWTDLGEPERHPNDMHHTLGPAARMHNIFNLLWASTLAEGFAQIAPDRRLFILSRSGFAGIQRYGVVTWSGDVAKSFGGLAVQVPMMLSMGLSGLAYHHSDIGGFCCGTTTPELYIRWMQFGAFSPVMRAHGGGGQGTEPWAFGTEAEEIARSFIGLRYRFLPYTYSMAHVQRLTGVPLTRPLFFADPANPDFRNETRAYLFGDALLVAPVLENGRRVQDVPLPGGEWVDFWTDETVAGGTTISAAAPLQRIPVFVRSGSLIPMAPLRQYSDERPNDTLCLSGYPDAFGHSTFTLYEDDGTTMGYERGEVAVTPLEQRTAVGDSGMSVEIRIGPTTGTYPGRAPRRPLLADLHRIIRPPSGVRMNGRSLGAFHSYDSLRRAQEGFYFHQTAGRLFIQASVADDSLCIIEAADVLTTGADEERGETDQDFRLFQNFPNPFNPITTISFAVPPPEPSATSLQVFDLLGRRVAVLVEGEVSPGFHTSTFDATHLSSGTYLYRLIVGRVTDVRKMTLVR